MLKNALSINNCNQWWINYYMQIVNVLIVKALFEFMLIVNGKYVLYRILWHRLSSFWLPFKIKILLSLLLFSNPT